MSAGQTQALRFGQRSSSTSTLVQIVAIVKRQVQQPDISAAARDRAPHRIARFAHELAGLFHSFYNGCRVLGVEPELTIARLALVAATQRVLKHALSILGVDAPEKM